MTSRSPNTERSSWLSHEAYVEALQEQAARFAAAVRGSAPAAAVPSCAGWTALDLVRHVVQVYAHKAAVLRAGAAVPGSQVEAAADLAFPQALQRHDAVVADLAALLLSLDPAAPAWTWMEGAGESTVGAWARRMAHEALVHRVDAELTAGQQIGPAPEPLAVDGVNEVLTWMAGDPDVAASQEGSVGAAGTLLLDHSGGAWLVELGDGFQRVTPAASGTPSDTRISGSAWAIGLSLWGRPSDAVWSGGPVVERLRGRLAAALR